MRTRFRSAIALALALVVGVCSAQAALCELACALGARSLLCHREIQHPAGTPIAQDHCGHARHATTAGTPALSAMHDGLCRHSAEPAIETEVSTRLLRTSAALTVIRLLPSALVLHCERHIPETSPALRPPHVDPLLVSLRV